MDQAKTPDASTDLEHSRGEIRKAAILKAAEEVFFEFGYENASMSEILGRSGGSMSTLYSQFGDKEGLFQAVVDQRAARLTRQAELELAAHTPLREGLQRIGEELLRRLLSQDSLDMTRLMISQSKKSPDMANRFTRQIPDRIRQAMARYLEDRVRAGEIQIGDCEAAAGAFADMVRTRLQFRALLDPSYVASDEEVHDAVGRAIKVFLGGAQAL